MNDSLLEGITIIGVGTITHPDGCLCAGEYCELDEEDE